MSEPECPECGANLYEYAVMGGALDIRCDECSYREYWSPADWIEQLEEDYEHRD